MKIGYARISTADQSLELQVDALKLTGCHKVFTDVASGSKSSRPGLDKALEYIRVGDTLVVWKLDRLGRSLKHLIEVVDSLAHKGIHFASVQENLDTSTSSGKLLFHIFGAIAEFERGLIQERTQAGLQAARARGRMGGRPKKMTPAKIKQAQILAADPSMTVGEICQALEISRDTYHRYVTKPDKNHLA
jgi:DNA invertase Pin-like site-specific DNA recombinase